MRRIGLISDTHGLPRPEAIRFLRGSNDTGRWAVGELKISGASVRARIRELI